MASVTSETSNDTSRKMKFVIDTDVEAESDREATRSEAENANIPEHNTVKEVTAESLPSKTLLGADNCGSVDGFKQ
jgi:hypothetical protein